jgi:stringent starvation protein B
VKDLDDIILDELQRIAEATTFDPNMTKRPDYPIFVGESAVHDDALCWYYVPDNHTTAVACLYEEDAEFIMAFNPKTAVVLLDEIRRLREQNDALIAENTQLQAHIDSLQQPTKKTIFNAMLSRGVVYVQLDARTPNTEVPWEHAGNFALVLRIGHGLTPPITDLQLGDAFLYATLMFNGVPSYCKIPWEAIYAMSVAGEGKTAVWEHDVPKEAMSGETAAAPEEPKKPNHLKLVD